MSETVSEALRSLYVANRQQLYTYAVSITRNRESAEDAIHRAFQRLLRLDSLPVGLRPYVFRCVRNAALDDLRRERVRAASVFEDGEVADREAGGAPGGLLAAEIEEALRRVSDDEREVIVLRIYNGLTFAEIAELREIPMPTVTSWYRRGLAKLRAAWRKDFP